MFWFDGQEVKVRKRLIIRISFSSYLIIENNHSFLIQILNFTFQKSSEFESKNLKNVKIYIY